MKHIIFFVILFFSCLFLCSGCNTPNRIENHETFYWIDTDIGFDSDDLMALLLATEVLGERLIGVSTNLYDPLEKAKMSRVILDYAGFKNIPVYAGSGLEKTSIKKFQDKYPYWPPQFGAPYSLQAQSVKNILGSLNFEKLKVSQTPAHEALNLALKKNPNKIVVIALGPLTNIAKAIEESPQSAKLIKRLAIMGGWKEDQKGNIVRPGYNTIMDLTASSKIFSNNDLKIDLITTNLITNDLRLSDEDFVKISEQDSPLGKILKTDISNWAIEIGLKDKKLWLYDPVALMVASNNEWIKETEPVDVELKHYAGAHMKNKLAAKLIKVKKGTGHIRNISKINKPHQLQKRIADGLVKSIAK